MITTRRKTWPVGKSGCSERLLEESVASLDLDARAINALENGGILNIESLLNSRPEHLLELQGFGVRSIAAVFDALAGLGFRRGNLEMVKKMAKQMKKTRQAAPGKKLLSTADTLSRCIGELYVLMESAILRFGQDDPQVLGLAWVIDYAETRVPYAPEAIQAVEEAAAGADAAHDADKAQPEQDAQEEDEDEEDDDVEEEDIPDDEDELDDEDDDDEDDDISDEDDDEDDGYEDEEYGVDEEDDNE
jgi:hypothetical protein